MVYRLCDHRKGPAENRLQDMQYEADVYFKIPVPIAENLFQFLRQIHSKNILTVACHRLIYNSQTFWHTEGTPDQD